MDRELDELIKERVDATTWPHMFVLDDRVNRLAVDQSETETRPAIFPLEMTCGKYTVATFQAVYVGLKALSNIAASLQLAHRAPLVSDEALWGPFVLLQNDVLTGWLSNATGTKGALLEAVLTDLSFEPDNGRSDLELSPLIPHGDQIWIPFHILQTYRWEDNLARLWNVLYPNVYGGTVGRQKAYLAKEVREAFEAKPFNISPTDRPIRNAAGEVVTDVDIAVASPGERLLLILETKWPLSPANVKEAGKADAEITKGFVQLEAVRAELEARPLEVLQMIFPGQPATKWGELRAHYVQLVRGVYPSANVLMKFPTVPADPAMDYILESTKESLAAIIHDLEEPPESRLLGELEKYRSAITLAGFRFVIPSWTWSRVAGAMPEQGAVQMSRNARCGCGSGRKYKRCCELVTRSRHFVGLQRLPEEAS